MSGYDGLSSVAVTTNVSGGLKLTDGMTMSYWTITPQSVDTTEMTSMNRLFCYYGDSATGTMSYPVIDTSNVTDMSNMFYKELDIGGYLNNDFILNFDTSKVTTMESMFAYTKTSNFSKYNKFISFVEGLDTSKVTNMHWMFYGYEKGSVSNSSAFFPKVDSSKATNMQGMFQNSQFKLFPSNFTYNTSACINMTNIFTSSGINVDSGSNTFSGILDMCINCDNTNYEGTKTLYALGFRNSMVSPGYFQYCSNYQDFLDAGWTIGY